MKLTNHIYKGANERESLIDFQEPEGFDYKNIIIFVHGYKGYKDWGAWNLVQDYFVKGGYAFCKFNMSHNGGTTDEPIDFPDLDAFSRNRYTYELTDLESVLAWIEEKIDISDKNIHLIGHSRGGGISLLKGNDPRIKSIVTWASISDIGSRFPQGETLEKWKENGSYTIENARTKQKMPHQYIMYEDFIKNKDVLNIESKAKELKKPVLHIHGDNDDSVSITESESLSVWTEGKLIVINEANHTFGTYQPFEAKEMPNKLHEACVLSLQFFEKL
ncbi:alpha/beta hydrolase [Brumimicrobium salinarum]|uniref:Alpha/beta hydrolase n=1 Tax=Brumimicrobium salinarum TaxID=2058658 RepID=A0A2I0R582_9FLAO|nr:alpha/beta hydrolase [Brumimicrobium salinarum]PKR81715.1 alpha/beta hydrolase [Brumimicrobium salinarum]